MECIPDLQRENSYVEHSSRKLILNRGNSVTLYIFPGSVFWIKEISYPVQDSKEWTPDFLRQAGPGILYLVIAGSFSTINDSGNFLSYTPHSRNSTTLYCIPEVIGSWIHFIVFQQMNGFQIYLCS